MQHLWLCYGNSKATAWKDTNWESTKTIFSDCLLFFVTVTVVALLLTSSETHLAVELWAICRVMSWIITMATSSNQSTQSCQMLKITLLLVRIMTQKFNLLHMVFFSAFKIWPKHWQYVWFFLLQRESKNETFAWICLMSTQTVCSNMVTHSESKTRYN